jgi:16S rRNA (guanine527-N7)-methyltransferase
MTDQPANLPSCQLAALLQPFAILNESQLRQTSTYINLIFKWNARINLTSVRKPEEIVTRHFGESFFAAAQLLAPRDPGSVIDLGSGAGFPGLPLAVLAPQAHVTLIESNTKKAAFLNEVIRALGLSNATVFNGRGEDYAGKAELVIMRAVEKFDVSLPLASAMLQPGGRLALMIGKSQIERAKALGRELAWSDPIDIPSGHSRVLLVGTGA